MPNRYWIPLDTRQVPKATHLHAVVCDWFDRPADGYDGVDHSAGDKPYRISAPASRRGELGVEVSTLTDAVNDRLRQVAVPSRTIRLGSEQEVQVGRGVKLSSNSWAELAQSTAVRGATWRVHFMTPTMFRTGQQSHLLPTPSLLLGGAARTWNLRSGQADIELPRDLDRHIHVTDLSLESAPIEVGGARLNGLIGYADFRCVSDGPAEAAATLFSFLPYVGVGSHKSRGLGCVDVEVRRRRPAA